MKLPTLYVVVRRDLALADIMPQMGHGILKMAMHVGIKIFENALRVRVDTWDDPLLKNETSPILIIKGARDLKRLEALADKLGRNDVSRALWYEPDQGPLEGQLTSLGAFGERDEIGPLFGDYHNLRWEDVPAFPNVAGAVKQERVACAGIAKRSQHECVVCGPNALVDPKPLQPCAACLEAARIEGAIRGRTTK